VKKLIVGDCTPSSRFVTTDPEARSEIEFEAVVVRALYCAYPAYDCVVFGGGFNLHGEVSRPDLALIAKDQSHWFVIEVELTSHSLERHVLPQVRAFQYGTPEPDCSRKLAKELGIYEARAEMMLQQIPRSVAVIANRRSDGWEAALSALSVQLIVVTVYETVAGDQAVEIDGDLEVVSRSLGFGTFSATDRSIRFPRQIGLANGRHKLHDRRRAASFWIVSETAETLWVTKELGTPDIEDGSFVQLVQTIDGKLLLRTPR
jgi:hypothetical protein